MDGVIFKCLPDGRHVVQCHLVDLPGDSLGILVHELVGAIPDGREPLGFEASLHVRDGDLGLEEGLDFSESEDEEPGHGDQQQAADHDVQLSTAVDPGSD